MLTHSLLTKVVPDGWAVKVTVTVLYCNRAKPSGTTLLLTIFSKSAISATSVPVFKRWSIRNTS